MSRNSKVIIALYQAAHVINVINTVNKTYSNAQIFLLVPLQLVSVTRAILVVSLIEREILKIDFPFNTLLSSDIISRFSLKTKTRKRSDQFAVLLTTWICSGRIAISRGAKSSGYKSNLSTN